MSLLQVSTQLSSLGTKVNQSFPEFPSRSCCFIISRYSEAKIFVGTTSVKKEAKKKKKKKKIYHLNIANNIANDFLKTNINIYYKDKNAHSTLI